MPTTEQVIQAIKNTFELQDDIDLELLSKSPEVSAIDGLSDLLKVLADEKNPPKIIGQALERVVLEIRLKDKPTTIERILDNQIQELVYDPQYNSGPCM